MIESVVFVLPSTVYPNSGSVLLRSRQLPALGAPHLARRGLETLASCRADFRNCILVVGKNALYESTADEIEGWRRRGNIVCADPLDGRIPDDLLDRADLLIASSHLQLQSFSHRVARQRVAYVAHHVDVRIGAIRPREDRLRLGYFGEIVNARHARALAGQVEFVRTDTARADDTSWMARLPERNAHYGVRARRTHDGFKPFTKGFVAAHCGCPILVDGSDGEARALLPSDYPYFADGASVAAVREVIRCMESGFGGSTWHRAVAAMQALRAVSAPDVVGRQLDDVIARTIG